MFGETGYTMYSGITSFERFAGLAYVIVHTDGYNQGGTTGLQGDNDDMGSTFTTLGIRSSTDIAVGGVMGSVKATLGWHHALAIPLPNQLTILPPRRHSPSRAYRSRRMSR